MLLRGEVHVIPLAASQRRTVEEMAGYRILRSPDFSVSFLGLNRNHPPLDREEVRQAIAMAIDREKLISPAAAGDDHARHRDPSPAAWPAIGPTPKVLPFDPDSARVLLARAGYGPGHPVPPIDFYSSSSRHQPLHAASCDGSWRTIGIELRTHQLSWSGSGRADHPGRGADVRALLDRRHSRSRRHPLLPLPLRGAEQPLRLPRRRRRLAPRGRAAHAARGGAVRALPADRSRPSSSGRP